MALLSAAPASPDLRNVTLALLACSKALITSSEAEKESWVITASVCGAAGVSVGGGKVGVAEAGARGGAVVAAGAVGGAEVEVGEAVACAHAEARTASA